MTDLAAIPRRHQHRYMEILCEIVGVNPTLLLKFGFPVLNATLEEKLSALEKLRGDLEAKSRKRKTRKC